MHCLGQDLSCGTFFYLATLTLKFDLLMKNFNINHNFLTVGAAVAEWLSSWLAEQEDRGSIPGIAT